MAEIKIRLPTPHPAQKKILDRASRFNAVAMGEKAGKTTLGIEVLITSKAGALSGKAPVAWFSATKDDLVEVRRTVMRAIDPMIKRVVNRREVELKSGNSLFFYSLDEPRDSFPQFGLIVVDNVRQVPDFLNLWEDVLSEALREHKGEAWFLSGAYGKRNDFYKLWHRGQSDPDWSCWQFDSFSNPHLPAETATEAMSVTESEYRQRFGAEFLDVAIELSAAQRVIGPDETFRQWCERLAADGLKVDGRPFTLENRPAMAWIYDQIPSNPEEAFRKTLVLMKCAQVGFTVMEMLAVIYLGIKFGPATVGMFLPDMNLAGLKSSERFMPIVRTIPPVHRLMTASNKDDGGKGGSEGNVRTRRIAEAMFVFSWTSGRATTESIPMDILSFDEVQEMTLEQMEKTRERLSASSIRYTIMGSTANWPDADIHHWYKRGSQFRFHTECPHCLNRKPLDDYFPECIKFDPSIDRHRYVCAECGGWIDDPQRGEWIPDAPENEKGEAPIRSIHFPQFLSPTISPGEIIFAYNTATDMKNFFNRKLGKPYLDPSQVPVNLEHLAACVEAGKAAGVTWKTRATGTYMGIDQMGNFNVVVIKERLPDGRQATIHVEEVYSADPFDRCSELMDAYGVAVCVVEINPNYNDAKRFANRHPGRVFICNSFGSVVEGMIVWGDGPKMDASDRRTDEDERDRYTLRMDQYKCMQVSMARFTGKQPFCLFPDPQGLVQEVIEKGQRQTVPVLPRMFTHLTKTALVAEKDEETNQYKRSVKKIGIDPHFSYANMLCDVAWSRSHGTSTFIIPPVGTSPAKTLDPHEIHVPGTVTAVLEQLQVSRDEVCGRCTNRDEATGFCNENGYKVKPGDPGCWAFIAKEGA
ncbi:MAG: phage terminase large subunit family protein [Armatimonadia bacterium]